MSQKRSWCRGLIPPFWWWFFTLLGLPLLFLLMTYFRQGVVEQDLSGRVNDALAAENIDWAEVIVDQRGRDVLLKGTPASDDQREQALAVAQAVYGVNQVDVVADDAELGAVAAATASSDPAAQTEPAEPAEATTAAADPEPAATGTTDTPPQSTEAAAALPTLNMALSSGQLSLQGELGSQAQIDALLKSAGDRFGAENVSNQLRVKPDVAEPAWLASADELFGVLPDRQAGLNLAADGGYEIAGLVGSEAEKSAMLLRAQRLLGDAVVDNIEVRALVTPVLTARLEADERMVLEGTLSSQAQVQSLLDAAQQRVGTANVVNQLEVDNGYADAAWLEAASGVIRQFPVQQGRAVVENGTLLLEGAVADDDARNALVAETNEALQGSGLTLVHRLAIDNAADKACQQQLDAVMEGKTILFEVNKDAIRRDSLPLLDQLSGIMKTCQAALSDRYILIGGHTDSDGSDDYNQQLSQRRADAVKQYLQDKGVDATQLTAKGFGESEPVAANDSAANKAKNRRISFDIKQQ